MSELKPLRIAILTHLYPPDPAGGLEENAKKLADAFARHGHEVTVFTANTGIPVIESLHPDHEPTIRRVLRLIDIVTPADQGMKREILRKVFAERKTILRNRNVLASEVARSKFDVVYCFGVSLIGPGCTLAFSDAGIPVFWHQGGPYLQARFLPPKSESKLMQLRRRLLRFEEKCDFRQLCFVSQFLLNLCKESGFVEEFARGRATMRVIPRGIEFPLAKDIRRERTQVFRFVAAGRIIPDKGFHNIVAALGQVRRKHPEKSFEFWIVGEPDFSDMRTISDHNYVDKLKTAAADLGLADSVKFVGRKSRSELLEIVKDSHCFISASICGEPFANTIIESLGCGTPLIVSDDGSSQEVVEDRVSALVYPKEDVDALACAIEETLNDYESALHRADAAIRTIEERFTIDAIVIRTEAVLREVVAASR